MREDFLKFIPVHDVTGKGLTTNLKDNLKEIGLELKYLRGQGYDGAATLSGHFNGVQAHVTKNYHLTIHSLQFLLFEFGIIRCL